MKYFIITVDTEGDNLWHYKKGQKITTENTLFIPRFQELSNKYGFKPVWLTNYEMVCDDRYVEFIKPMMERGLCEVGIHIHAWNNPPLYDLNGHYGGNPYLIEYPNDVMRAKFKMTFDLISKRFGRAPFSHRAGRWAMNDEYFRILEDNNVLVDCSFTPTVSWAGMPGETIKGANDYRNVNNQLHWIGHVLQVPMSIRRTHYSNCGSFKHRLKVFLKGESVWLRPATSSLEEMKALVNKIDKESCCDYLEFMVHSSELMPGGSPYFLDNKSIEHLYQTMESLFEYVRQKGYQGITLEEYYKLKR